MSEVPGMAPPTQLEPVPQSAGLTVPFQVCEAACADAAISSDAATVAARARVPMLSGVNAGRLVGMPALDVILFFMAIFITIDVPFFSSGWMRVCLLFRRRIALNSIARKTSMGYID